MANVAGSTSSPMTSTSQTLTQFPVLSKECSKAAVMSALLTSIQSARHELLRPTSVLSHASLELAKSTLDAYAGQVSDEQRQRLQEAGKKRKRATDGMFRSEVLKIRNLHVDGFEHGQVWQQAKRMITSTLKDSLDALGELKESNAVDTNPTDSGTQNDHIEPVSFDEATLEAGRIVSDGETGSRAEDPDAGLEEDDKDEPEEVDEDEPGNEQAGGDYESPDDGEQDADAANSEALVEDPNGLNDGFFSIDEFNKQTQWFENQDAKADPNTDVASDDEVDWHTDPLAEIPKIKSTTKVNESEDDDEPLELEDVDDEEVGPTFGDMDLDAPEGDSEDDAVEDLNGDEGEFNANDVFYKDFFAPPQKKASKNAKARKSALKDARPNANDVERAMTDVRRDLFEDESEHDDSDDALSELDAGDPRSRRSAHERRQASLAEEIRKLEAANVAEKKWTLAGEATGADRPKHALLDEEMDFEHAGKPVPVITTEVSESIEDLIKRRILAREFDEVIRRRPDSLDQSVASRRGLVELEDTKAKQSLAELYEEEHIKNTNPDTYVSKSDEKLHKEEAEVEQLWKEVSGKLDALSSWHYKPKPPAPSLTVVSDMATISMEDAQPTTAQGVSGGDNRLAPQEIYQPGKDTAEKGEVVTKSGLPLAKQELSREDNAKARRRHKEKIRKAGGAGVKKLSGKAQARKDTIGELKKGGVKVINRKGEILNMDGQKAQAAKALSGAALRL